MTGVVGPTGNLLAGAWSDAESGFRPYVRLRTCPRRVLDAAWKADSKSRYWGQAQGSLPTTDGHAGTVSEVISPRLQ